MKSDLLSRPAHDSSISQIRGLSTEGQDAHPVDWNNVSGFPLGLPVDRSPFATARHKQIQQYEAYRWALRSAHDSPMTPPGLPQDSPGTPPGLPHNPPAPADPAVDFSLRARYQRTPAVPSMYSTKPGHQQCSVPAQYRPQCQTSASAPKLVPTWYQTGTATWYHRTTATPSYCRTYV